MLTELQTDVQPEAKPLSPERLAPHNFEAEQLVLAAIIRSKEAMPLVDGLLEPADFFIARHQLIYNACRTLSRSHTPIDQFLVYTLLEKQGQDNSLYDSDGASYLNKLRDCPRVGADQLTAYAQLIASYAIRRVVIAACSDIVQQAQDLKTSQSQFMESASALFYQATNRRIETHQTSYSAALSTLYKTVSDRYEVNQTRKGGGQGAMLGVGQWDRFFPNGFLGGELVVGVAAPGTGKTSLGMQFADHIAGIQGRAVQIFSLEMPTENIVARKVAASAGLTAKQIRAANFANTEEAERAFNTMTALMAAKEVPYYLNDGYHTVTEILAITRALKGRLSADTPLGLVVVDNLQLIKRQYDKHNREMREDQAIHDIIVHLSNMAKELDVPVLLLAHPNRQYKEAKSAKDMDFYHIFGSGSVEKFSNIVFFLVPDDDLITVSVKKNRDEALGSFKLRFLKRETRFTNPSEAMVYDKRDKVVMMTKDEDFSDVPF